MPSPYKIRADITRTISARIEAYNKTPRGDSYNKHYAKLIQVRLAGVRNCGLAAWLKTAESRSAIRSLLEEFGMDARKSQLAPATIFDMNISQIPDIANIEWLSRFQLSEESLSKSGGSSTVAEQIGKLFDFCADRGRFSESGGFVIGTKVAHCVLPEVIPMIDISHIGISLYNVPRKEYLPPGDVWRRYIGYEPRGKPNPSPNGAGRNSWKSDQILCAIGFYTRIYRDWLAFDEGNNLEKFLALDRSNGATGIPRLLDKVLW